MPDINTPIDPELDVHDQDEIDAIHDFDFNRVGLLLHIMEKQVNVSPKATHLFGIAQAEIEILNEQAKAIAKSRADKTKQAEQRRYEAEQKRVADETAAIDAQAEAQQAHRRGHPPVEPPPGPGMPSPDRQLAATDDGKEKDDGTIKPSVFPADSQTATIADRRI
jgi:hypothetical protein